jgi:hypothetical protein
MTRRIARRYDVTAVRYAIPVLFLIPYLCPAQSQIVQAAKSPDTLARFLESHHEIDWAGLRRSLGLPKSQYWMAPCGGGFWAADRQCTVEVQQIERPRQVILIIRGDIVAVSAEYLRFVWDAKGGWHFAGEYNADQMYSNRGVYHFLEFGERVFLAVSSDHSQNGFATQQVMEDWFDLSQPGFAPVFSITLDGSNGRFGFGLSREIHASCGFNRAPGVETIEVDLRVTYGEYGTSNDESYVGIYERRTNEAKFTIRRAYEGQDRKPFPPADFVDLDDPFSGIVNEKLLVYSLPSLREIASGTDDDAKSWLRLVLDHIKDTPEKRILLSVMKSH